MTATTRTRSAQRISADDAAALVRSGDWIDDGAVGGQLQFVRGGYASNGGKSFICMSSTYERSCIHRSRVVPELTPGNIVTAPRSDVMFVVADYGIFNLKGKSVPERAEAMISIAHPDFRDDLGREARAAGLIPRSSHRAGSRPLTLAVSWCQ